MFTKSITSARRPELADDQIRSLAPSVFATSPLPDVSQRYAFVPTAQIVSQLRESGWSPVVSGQSKPARDGQLKSGHFEEDIALSAMGVAQGRDEYTQREPATFDNNAVEARLVIPADCA